MGFSSQAGQLIVRSQAVADTFQADIATKGVGILLRSGSLAINRDLMTLEPEIGGGRDTSDANLGPAHYEGDLDMYPRMAGLPTLLRSNFGVSSSVAGTPTGVFNHTFTPTDSGTLPFLSVYEDVGGGLQRSNFWDVVVNSMHFEVDADGYLQSTAGLIARKALLSAANITAPTLFDRTGTFVGTNTLITYGGVTLPAKSFSLDINNNVETDDHRLGSFDLADLTAKQREVTGSFSMRHVGDAAYYRQASLGKATATAVGGETTKDQLVITSISYANIGATTVKYMISFTIPFAIFSPFGLSPSGDDVLENDIDFTGLRASNASPIITCVVRNGSDSIA